MAKNQSKRLTTEKISSQGPKEMFNKAAKQHDVSVNHCSEEVIIKLKKDFPKLEFRLRSEIKKKEINEKLNSIDSRLGISLFVASSSIKPDGGIIEVKDKMGNWRIVLISEAKHQGKDIDNIQKGILVGKNKNKELMVAGNAIERSHKNINEARNLMLDEKHFPYVLFLQGSNFLTEQYIVKKPNGDKVILDSSSGSLNRLDRLTSANYGLKINENHCENLIISVNERIVMLQAVSIYTNPTKWNHTEMLLYMLNVSLTSLRMLKLIP